MKNIIKIVVLCFSSLSLSSCLFHTINLAQGIEDFRQQDYRSAFIRLKPAAERGQHDAEYAVGYMYYYGQGVIEDRKKAAFWISRAAAGGQPDAIAAQDMIKNSRVRLMPIR